MTPDQVALLAVLQHALAYTFHQPERLEQALTHRSYAHEASEERGDYERLEFLGDAVLGLIVSAYLYERYPTYNEGHLSQLRACLVRREGLAALARQLALGRFLLLGRGEEQGGGRDKDSLLAAAFEAVLAAIYLDGGWEAAQRVFLQCFTTMIEQWESLYLERDYKSLLQQRALSIFGATPTYCVVHEEGPAHQKTFHVQITLHRDLRCLGIGRSKKAAEQHAAAQLLALLQEDTCQAC
jgi:ribonuclease III